jgi:hypothetical protein
MTKPVAVFRSGVIGDSRHTVRLDENSHSVLFPSFSRYIKESLCETFFLRTFFFQRTFFSSEHVITETAYKRCVYPLTQSLPQGMTTSS